MWNPFEKISKFYKSITTELGKCTWPTWEELYESTTLVIFSSILLSLFVFVVDLVIQRIVKYVT
jgi:preprotein translocase subunit SecE